MNRENWNGKGKRLLGGVMSLLLAGSLLGGMAVEVKAAEPPDILVIQGGENDEPFTFDFENPPALEDGLAPPEVGLGEDFGLGKKPEEMLTDVMVRIIRDTVLQWALSKGFDYSQNAILNGLFGNSEAEELNAILAQQSKIKNLLDQLLNTIRKVDLKKQIRAKMNETSTLWTSYTTKATAISNPRMTEAQRMKSLQAYFNGSGNNYVLRVINLYTNSLESKNMPNGNIFAAYDAYCLYNFYWENQGYDFRDGLRALDAAQFMQMWTLAWLSCQAHIDGGTQYANAAAEAQMRLLDCIGAAPDGRRNELMGLQDLLLNTRVERQPEGYYFFQVPGRQIRYFISPMQPALLPLGSTDDVNDHYLGWTVGDAIRSLSIDYQGRSVLRDTEFDFIWRYYQENNPKPNMARIFYEATGLEAFNSNDGKGSSTGFLVNRSFYADRNEHRDYSFMPYTYGGDSNAYKWYFKVWLSGGDTEHDRIRKCLDVFDFEPMYRVCRAPQDESPAEEFIPDVATESECTDSGVITEVTDEGLVLTVDMGDSPLPVTEKVRITPATTWGDGTAVGMENLQHLLNNSVEISGTYTYADETLAAKTIVVKSNSGVQEVSGTVVSSVANAVMVLEDGSGTTNGYFLPNVQEDVPNGSRITLRYHWENGTKTVDSYELQDGPMPGPVPAPVPEPQPDPEPDPNPVDGPVSSEPLPQTA